VPELWPLLLAYPAYLLLMAGVMRVCGVSKEEIAKWVLRQADRQRLTDLIRAARGLPEPPPPPPAVEPPLDGPPPASP
jgi:hypothetical protein